MALEQQAQCQAGVAAGEVVDEAVAFGLAKNRRFPEGAAIGVPQQRHTGSTITLGGMSDDFCR